MVFTATVSRAFSTADVELGSALSWIMKVQALVYAIYAVWLVAHCISLKEDAEASTSSAFLALAFVFNMLLLVF